MSNQKEYEFVRDLNNYILGYRLLRDKNGYYWIQENPTSVAKCPVWFARNYAGMGVKDRIALEEICDNIKYRDITTKALESHYKDGVIVQMKEEFDMSKKEKNTTTTEEKTKFGEREREEKAMAILKELRDLGYDKDFVEEKFKEVCTPSVNGIYLADWGGDDSIILKGGFADHVIRSDGSSTSYDPDEEQVEYHCKSRMSLVEVCEMFGYREELNRLIKKGD